MRRERLTKNQVSQNILLFLILLLWPVLQDKISGQEEELRSLYLQANLKAELRSHFVDSHMQQEELPDYVLLIEYSEEVTVLAETKPLVRYNNDGELHRTKAAFRIGHGHPSIITFGPKMFRSAYRYVDFVSVFEHEAAHAKFWATGKLNHMERLGEEEMRQVRIRGILPILFELDAIKTQLDHPSWIQTSDAFRKGQERYRQMWLEKLKQARERYQPPEVERLLERIWRKYK